jgi:hypothetical protein
MSVYSYIPSKSHYAYICIGLPTGTEIQKNMKDRSIQWEKALMEVLGFINRASCNYGSDTETHEGQHSFHMGCCKLYCTAHTAGLGF